MRGRGGPRRSQAPLKLLWFLEISLILSLLVPVTAIATTQDVGRSSAWILTVLILVWSGLRLALVIASGRPNLFQFIFWLFCYVFLGLAPTVQMRTGLISTTTRDMPAHVDWVVALLIVCSLLAFEVGTRLRFKLGNEARVARTRKLSTAWSYALMGVGLLFMAYYVQSVGLSALFQTREARQMARAATFSDQSGASIVSALAWVPSLIAGGALLLQRRSAPDDRRFIMLVSAVVCLAGVLIVVNPISGARYTSGTVLFAMACYTGILQRERMIRFLLAGLIIAFLFLFPIADAFRRAGSNAERQGFFAEYERNGDYDSFWQIGNALLYLDQNGPTWGRQGLGVVLFWFPRSIWPSKADDSGVVLAEFRNYGFTNLSAPLWAEALLNGGIALLMITFLLLGMLLARLDRAIPTALDGGTGLAVAACVFPAYFIILLRGSLLQATGVFAVMLACIWLVSRGRLVPAQPHSG